MDAELLKCKKTHDCMSTYGPKARKLLHLLSYLNQTDARRDPEIIAYKQSLRCMLSKCVKIKHPPINVAYFELNSLHLALLHQCDMDVECEGDGECQECSMTLSACICDPRPPGCNDSAVGGGGGNGPQSRLGLVDAYMSLIDDWRRFVLSLDDSDEHLGEIYNGFCRVSSFISLPPSELETRLDEFVCPLCVLDDVFTDIGWTDYVCPKQVGGEEFLSTVSKRGVDPDIPAGACEHLLSTIKTAHQKLQQQVNRGAGETC
ncbi:hypothetical protein RRG08_010283 [Elysia crispata]|uniref:Uncharacterized protein n=1 Tax=Elysia crispata TaxID=231223 RepID=A0AAE0Z2C9_9GAST|nr:hypothetical protein RRG08_010283 [Elysia crispata]